MKHTLLLLPLLLVGCTTTQTTQTPSEPIPVLGETELPVVFVPEPTPEPVIEPVAINPSRPVTMTSEPPSPVTVAAPELEASPPQYASVRQWLEQRDKSKVYPRLIQPRGVPDVEWIKAMESLARPKP